jgi:hypothetical protein
MKPTVLLLRDWINQALGAAFSIPLPHLAPEDTHISGGFYRYPDGSGILEYLHGNIFTDGKVFTGFQLQQQHGKLLSPSAHSIGPPALPTGFHRQNILNTPQGFQRAHTPSRFPLDGPENAERNAIF